MTTQGRWNLLVFTIMLSGVVLGGVLVSGRPGKQSHGVNPMKASRFTVDHVRLATDKPFEVVTKAFERQLGRFDPDVYEFLAATGDNERAKAKIEAMVGTSGFMQFRTTDHGKLLSILGKKKKDQYCPANTLGILHNVILYSWLR